MSNLKGRGHCQSCQIRHLSIFAQLPMDRLIEIQAFQPSVVTYSADETVYYQGDASLNAFTLRKGLVKLIKTLPNGRTQIVRVLRTGDLFGFDGFAGESYNHTAIPLSEIEVCRLPLQDLTELKKQNAEIENTMMKRWIQHLREAEDMMLELGAKKAAERLASFLIRWCENNNGGWVPLPLSRAEVGELLGLTIETVSRFLSDWKRQGFLNEQRGSIQLENVDGLRKAVCANGSC
ncbi:Crp/Fnr family transcriptional regulator [Thiothrix lacustris]|uniref:Crp/Fnr family transcriptional regulator n=1 Tax=Thiothrix lacustris TaxID=525917 RepID=A0ABY9MPV3_9GAMM|nr:Crp/Fnr family transcriptional regulator [Thiothrix lacustris]WML90602.1 Crp/Fnr family transcriptional regulator [Thiothrix lacustris]WMP17728.1 Crp/Fnr family transcriptional regulator [Thiothrix lacustris]